MNLTLVNRYPVTTPTEQRVPENASERFLFLDDKLVLSAGTFLDNGMFEQAVESMATALNEAVVHYDDLYDVEGQETSDEITERLSHWLVLPRDQKPLRFAVHLEGGLIQSILCDDPRGRNVLFSVYDYDVESVEDDEITLITDLNDGKKEEAFVQHMKACFNVSINLDDVYNAK